MTGFICDELPEIKVRDKSFTNSSGSCFTLCCSTRHYITAEVFIVFWLRECFAQVLLRAHWRQYIHDYIMSLDIFIAYVYLRENLSDSQELLVFIQESPSANCLTEYIVFHLLLHSYEKAKASLIRTLILYLSQGTLLIETSVLYPKSKCWL